MGKICPWWAGYFLANPLRKLIQHPEKILAPYLKHGMVAVDVGSGMGYFSLPMASLVGDTGRVICIDLQPKMISSLRKRAKKAGILERIETRQAEENSLKLDGEAGSADFVLAFSVVHEVPDQDRFLNEVGDVLKANGILLLSEPKGHVTAQQFTETKSAAQRRGLKIIDVPNIRGQYSAVMEKSPGR
jgi:ubiquinone/menaquinone biosynthesis C-methylase UbiE